MNFILFFKKESFLGQKNWEFFKILNLTNFANFFETLANFLMTQNQGKMIVP
jgi:hypothetical protein